MCARRSRPRYCVLDARIWSAILAQYDAAVMGGSGRKAAVLRLQREWKERLGTSCHPFTWRTLLRHRLSTVLSKTVTK